MRAKDMMSTPVVTARPQTPLKRIAELLVEHDISAVPIVDAAGDLVGMVSEADLLTLQRVGDPRRHLIPMPEGRKARVPTRAEQIMSLNVVTATEDADVTDIARRMLTLHLRRIPVVGGGKVVGIIARRDILKVLARSDASIEAELQARLDDEITLLGWFHARVADGIATLTGPDEKDGRRLAGLIARSIPGVVAVRFPGEDA